MSDLTEGAVAARVPTLLDAKIKVLNRRDPLTARPGTALAECLAAIQRSGVGDLVIVVEDDGRLAGVLTERDIFGRLIGSSVDVRQPVDDFMTTSPHTLSPEGSIREALELMQSGRYRNIPLVDEHGGLVGIVRQVDILKYLAEAFPEELLNLPPRPHQRMKEPEGA